MVCSEYSTDDYNFLTISIGAIMKNPEMPRLVPDYLKTKAIHKHVVQKLSFELRYVPDQYKTQKMCDKAILENVEILQSCPEQYRNQTMYDKAVDNHVQAL